MTPPLVADLRPPEIAELPFQGNKILMRGGLVSRELADEFVEVLRKLEEGENVDALVEIHCDGGNVALPRTFSGHDDLCEFWKAIVTPSAR